MEQIVKNKEIITFYSFKGGTGRTMALANIAVLISRLQNKILLIDWDLEAPGLHRYFANYISKNDEDLNTSPGLIDYFKKITENITTHYAGTEVLNAEQVKKILGMVNLKDFILETELTGISLLKAGAFTNEYPKNISLFQWETLFLRAPEFFKIFCDHLKETYDFILVDSRTGFTDTSGICTMLMPEKLCLVFTPNTQSLDGVSNLAKKALEYRMNSTDFRPLKIFPIPSRVELAEKDLRDQWRNGFNKTKSKISGADLAATEPAEAKNTGGFQPVFENIFNEYYGLTNCDMTRYFDEIQIHHEPKYSYGEDLAVLNETNTDRLSLTTVYSKILEKLLFEPKIYSERIIESDVEDKISIYLASGNFEKDAEFVQTLKKELEKLNRYTIVLNSGGDITAGENYLKAIEENIVNSEVVIPIISKNYLSSKFADFELYSISRSINSQSFNMTIPIYLDDVSDVGLSSNLLSRIQGINATERKPGDTRKIARQINEAIMTNKTSKKVLRK